jgi:hypothetical protein
VQSHIAGLKTCFCVADDVRAASPAKKKHVGQRFLKKFIIISPEKL